MDDSLKDKIILNSDMTKVQSKCAIDSALFLGFNSISSKFPIAIISNTEKSTSFLNFTDSDSNEIKNFPDNYVSSTNSAIKVRDFDWRKKKGLENLFSKGMFLEDKNFDMLPDYLNFKIKLPQDYDVSTVIAACNIACRFGMETTAYNGSIVADDNFEGNLITFVNSNEFGCKITLEEYGDENKFQIVKIFGEGKSLENFTSLLCENFPILLDNKTWSDMLQNMTESFSMKNSDGQIAYAKAISEKTNKKIQAYVSPQIFEKINEINKEVKNIEFFNHKEPVLLKEKQYDIPWEVDVLEEILEEKLYNILNQGDKVDIFCAISESKEIRSEILEKITKNIDNRRATYENIDIICSYKQGLSWIEEIVLPKLLDCSGAKKIQIAFKSFLPKGVSDWGDENGATPSYNNFGENNPDRWYDLPIRFLQELYPIDDIINEKLNVGKDNIHFIEYNGEDDITYEFIAYSEEDKILFEETYKVAYSERVFLDEFPELGKVHPSTGFLKVKVNNEIVINERIKSDVENIWDIYQSDVLKMCKDHIENTFGENLNSSVQPVFAKLQLDVEVSEPNYLLDSREDLLSTLDALHEDMYFVGSDYFKNYGLKFCGEILDAPGLILPIIRDVRGKPKFKASLYISKNDVPEIKSNNESIFKICDKNDISLFIDEISFENDKFDISINVDFENEFLENFLKSYLCLTEKTLTDASKLLLNTNSISFKTKYGKYSACIKEPDLIIKDLTIEDVYIPENVLIGYDQYIDIIENLKRVKGINVFKIAESYHGRKIYAIEPESKLEGYISRTKKITNYPSELINCRHHANEVSATTAAFMIIKNLLTEKKYENITEKLNLVIVPMENVDGSAIHYELQKDNPTWKFHVARFNAIGKEFFSDHFVDDTIHTEAEGIKNIYKLILPDVIIDNHGVPSHEWEQQFSGYTSPSFKGFWLPRSLLYGYFWTAEDEKFSSNIVLSKKMEDTIADALGNDGEITSLNIGWAQIFEKYAHKWMPKLFPASYYKNMINYWIPRKVGLDQRYASHKYPWITTTYYTGEIADETAQGDYLFLCARAQLINNMAVIDLLLDSKCIYEKETKLTSDLVSVRNIRHRPIL